MNLADMVALLDYCEGDVSPIYNFLYGWFRNEKMLTYLAVWIYHPQLSELADAFHLHTRTRTNGLMLF